MLPNKIKFWEIISGILTILGINLLLGIIYLLIVLAIGDQQALMTSAYLMGSLISLYQLIYVIPLVIYLIVEIRWFFMIGVITGALLTFFGILNFLFLFFFF